MITINLIRGSEGRARFKRPASLNTDALIALGVAIAILAVGAWYFYLGSARTSALEQKEALQQQSLQLAAVRAQIQQFEALRKKLADRAQVISELRLSQKGPVEMMNAIIGSIPDQPRLWLVRLEQEEDSVKIQGESLDVPAIADFVSSLGETQPFASVELNYWEQGSDSISFELSCRTRNE